MNIIGKIIFIIFLMSTQLMEMTFANNLKNNKKVTVKYLKHTEINLSGNTIEGEVKMPQVFYIFQRKRFQGHHITTPPNSFAYHQNFTKNVVKENFSP